MRKAVLFLLPALLSSFNSLAQCEGCPPSVVKIDYCFKLEQLPGKCAQFSANSDVFYFSHSAKSKKATTISIPKKIDVQNILGISKVHKKLKTEDVLFIQEALKKWETEKMDIGYQYTPSGLGYKVLTEGTGPKPAIGNKVTVHYKGMLKDGTVFDSSFERNQPATFPIGVGQLIRGWDEGIPMFNQGSRVMLRIPPELGYGSRNAGSIPANSVLYFEIELIDAGQQ